MPDKLPADFDPNRYRAAYPDVALTGIDPAEHYLRFGSLMGRNPSGKEAAPKPEQPQPKQAKSVERSAAAAGSDLKQVKVAAPPREVRPIVASPDDFDPQEVIAAAAPEKQGANEDGAFTLAILSDGLEETVAAPIAGYAHMFGLESIAAAEPELGESRIASAGIRIENAWFSTVRTVRLMISVPGDGSKWALRAYQADAPTPGDLRLTGTGIQLPTNGPLFHELQLLNPLMPLLLEIEDTEAHTRSIALMPFPSLLPGGFHSAELRALQRDPNPMEAFWSLSELLLRELLGGPGFAERSIACLSVAGEGDGTPRVTELEPWLSAVFGVGLQAEKQSQGLQLQLPRDCIPTISALVSRGLDRRAARSAPFLVAEPWNFQPRWSVVLPSGWDAGPNVPSMVGRGSVSAARKDFDAVPLHVAIALRHSPDPKVPTGEGGVVQLKRSRSGLKLSVLIDASDETRTDGLVTALRSATSAKGLELFVIVPEGDRSIAEALNSACGPDGWTAVGANAGLPAVARDARHDLLLTISDRVVLDEPEVVKALAALIEQDEKVASSSCVLLTEASIKRQIVLQPASGGLFPSEVSFATSPTLAFFEPDVLQALPDLTYPVAANSFLLTLWRRHTLANLIPGPALVSDVGIGIALLDAGLRNLCTTKRSARLTGRFVRRDAIDPIGQTWIDPQQWGRILGEVTLLRQLF